MKKTLTFVVLGLALVYAVGSWADDTTATDTMKTDQHVLSKIHHGNHCEIEMAQLALTQVQSNGLKEFSNDIIQDHGKADLEVKLTAKKESVMIQEPMVPANDTEKQAAKDEKAEMKKLHSLKGAEFDAEYQSVMIAGHKKTIADLRAALPTVGKPTHDLIEKLLPEFEKHLQMIEKLKA